MTSDSAFQPAVAARFLALRARNASHPNLGADRRRGYLYRDRTTVRVNLLQVADTQGAIRGNPHKL